ncbi:3-oxoacyl-[acyl-carrier-protein] synthase III C-terminal domain-containing protein [Marinicella sp. W31]|uniref:3-oxoacyl-[acyl-carrier-protein] synthase III C-terminal domain-containing protein n=1 Tax=Marinicella sp. W31 TaxID=3023713 RepID=UPI003758317A
MLCLNSIEINFPEKRLHIGEDFEELGINHLQSRVYNRLYGFSQCPVADGAENSLLINAIKTLIQSHSIDTDKITYLMHAHTGPYIGPHCDNVLRQASRELGLTRAQLFGTQLNKCVSVISAFDMMDKLLQGQAKGAQAIVLIGEVANSKELRVLDSAIVGDVGLAVLVNKNGMRNKILAHCIEVHDAYAKGIWMEPGSELSRQYDHNYQKNLLSLINRVLDEAQISLQEIKLILPHNVNIQIWKKAIPVLGIPEERVYLKNISKYAHCFGADILINYFSAINDGAIEKGDVCLLVTVGVGGVFGACIIQH